VAERAPDIGKRRRYRWRVGVHARNSKAATVWA
jgi:hypothetical protein